MSSAKIKMMCGGLLTSVSIKIVNTITDNTIVAITPSTNKRDKMKIPLFFMVLKRSVRERKRVEINALYSSRSMQMI